MREYVDRYGTTLVVGTEVVIRYGTGLREKTVERLEHGLIYVNGIQRGIPDEDVIAMNWSEINIE